MASDLVGPLSYQDESGKTKFLDVPTVTKEPRQRSLSLDDIYLTRYISPWVRNPQANADTWRWWVYNEPIAMICRETLIANIIALDWEITSRDSSKREELRGVIKHYTDLLESGGNRSELGLDYTGLIEWISADLLDLPFGTASELGRRYNKPNDRVMWIKPLDAGTLYPTLNKDYPVMQMYSNYDIVTFPAHTISRVYMSPRTELIQEGWGMAPPEKAYFALRMVYLGDTYYKDLMTDTPPSGILDLMDVEWDDALRWAESLKDFYMGNRSSMKIPVLAEHNSEVKFIDFGKVPNDIMYDKIILKYAAIVASAYGISLSDIGLQTTSSSGQTLAGSIRDERKSKRTGFARLKKKLKYWVESFLPKELEFNFIDLDDELNVALGRARLATLTSLGQAIDKGIIDAKEARLIFIGDGLAGNTSLPEEPPEDARKVTENLAKNPAPERPGMLGRPEAASSGGQGEVRKMKSISLEKTKHFDSHLKRFLGDVTRQIGQVIEAEKDKVSLDELYLVRSMVDTSLFGEEDYLEIVPIIRALWENKRWFKVKTSGLAEELEKVAVECAEDYVEAKFLHTDEEFDLEEKIDEIKEKLHNVDWEGVSEQFSDILDENVKVFLGKSAVYVMKDLLLSEKGFDIDAEEGDNNIVDKIYQNVVQNFDEFAHVGINADVENLIDMIIEEMMK